jgi:hypothetical protein
MEKHTDDIGEGDFDVLYDIDWDSFEISEQLALLIRGPDVSSSGDILTVEPADRYQLIREIFSTSFI